jgi:hypothetical protein
MRGPSILHCLLQFLFHCFVLYFVEGFHSLDYTYS